MDQFGTGHSNLAKSINIGASLHSNVTSPTHGSLGPTNKLVRYKNDSRNVMSPQTLASQF